MIKVKNDLSGVVFERLTVVRQADDHIKPNGKKEATWLCQCSCWSEPKIILQMSLLKGNTKSCGCLVRDGAIARNTTHGKHNSRTYKSWEGMIQRCTNSRVPNFDNYGGRGIKVCERWLNSFEAFYEDMGDCPEGMSLDRIDVNGDYCKDNCKWSTRGEQNYNQRKKKTNTSGRTGVYWNASISKWYSRIRKDGKQYDLGIYSSFDDAVMAREAAELLLYGYTKQ